MLPRRNADNLLWRQTNHAEYFASMGLFGDSYKTVQKFGGANSAQIADAGKVVWNAISTAAYPFPTAALAVRIKAGGNAADTAAGTGARTITVAGVDANSREISETLTTAGASASSPTTLTFLRVNRIFVVTAGSSGSNVGVVDVEYTDGTLTGRIEAGRGQSRIGAWHIPAGYSAVITEMEASVNKASGASANANFGFYTWDKVAGGAIRLKNNISAGLGDTNVSTTRIPVGEKTDVFMRMDALSANTTDITAHFHVDYFRTDLLSTLY